MPIRPKVQIQELSKQRQGQRAYLSGQSAEQATAKSYAERGVKVLETRWRGESGEVDLILLDHKTYVFCEVKKARSFEDAIHRLTLPQMKRIHSAASEYLGSTPNGFLSDVRFDLAVSDQHGHVKILENAFSHL